MAHVWAANQSRTQKLGERLRPTTEPPCRRDLSRSTAHVERPMLSAIIQTFNDHKQGQPQQLVRRLKLIPIAIEIIVNDDSQNGPAEWLPMLTGPNDFYVASPNVHELRAYDRLARMARGDFLVLLQGDFCLPSTPGWMLDAMTLFRQLPMLGLLGGNLGFREEIKHGQAREVQRDIGWGRSKYRPIRHLHNTTPFQWVHGVNIGPLFIRRETFHILGGFDESFSCPGEPGIGLDVELSLRVWELGKGVGVYYSGVSNGIGGRKSQSAPARRRNEVLNQARCEPLWRRLNASISSRITVANAQLTTLSVTRAGELRDTRLRKGIYGPGVSSQCAEMDPRWIEALQGRSYRVNCMNMTNFSSPDATRQGNDWQLCLDDWEPAQGCLVFSVGVGNAWQFDDALATQLGCEVHSFDPTQELLAAHEAHHVPGVHFHFVGLGQTRTSTYGTKGRGAQMQPLPEIMSRWAGKRTIDVLKIDCEGCEWAVLYLLAHEYPNVLRRVRLILIELHVSKRMVKRKSTNVFELRVFMNHVIRDHGFRIYRHRTNLGKMRDRMNALSELAQAGLDPEPCCYELHLMRENSTAVPNSEPWSTVPKLESEPSLSTIRASDMQTLVEYDRNHGTHHVERIQTLRAKAKGSSSGSRRLSSVASDSKSGEEQRSSCTNATCPLETLGGTTSKMFLERLTDPRRCPCSRVPENALVVDGGTSGVDIDAVQWLNAQEGWHALSFDPLPANCKEARAQLARFGARSNFLCKALAGRPGVAAFEVSADAQQGRIDSSGGAKHHPIHAEEIQIPTTTLDIELPTPSTHVFLLKLDLQGAELRALQGAARLLAERRVSWLFMEWDPALLGASARTVLDLLYDSGFACVNSRARNTWAKWKCNAVTPDGIQACYTDLLCGTSGVTTASERDWRESIVRAYCRQQLTMGHLAPGFNQSRALWGWQRIPRTVPWQLCSQIH